MRILHVISGLGTGGAESFLATLAPRLAARGLEQAVVSLTGDGPVAARLEADQIPVVRLNARGGISAIRAVVALRQVVASRQPDVLQGWMYHGDLLAAVAHRLVTRRDRRLFWNIRCSDMQLADYARQLRLVVRACRHLSRLPDVVLANSSAGARVHTAAGYRPHRLVIVPNGIDCARFRLDPQARAAVRAELGLALDAVVAMHVARVDPMKDHAGLLAAVARVEGLVTVLIGAGTEALARSPHVLGLGRREDVARLLCAGDLIVSSSAYGEGFSNALAEGMAAGLVPVATDVGDAGEIVGSTGAIVPPRDPAALAAALERIALLSASERSPRGAAARSRIECRFSLEAAVDRFEALYRGTLT
jgi:glycosyltransferase involved in cell wall biosynthesis